MFAADNTNNTSNTNNGSMMATGEYGAGGGGNGGGGDVSAAASSMMGTAAGGLRHRNKPQQAILNDDGGDESKSKKALRTFAQAADFFPKPKEDFRRQQTAAGGKVSMIGLCVLCLLLFIELSRYTLGWDSYHTEAAVDMNLNQNVPFNIDITFPAIPCHELTLYAMDATGHFEDDLASRGLRKTPVDANGYPSQWVGDGYAYNMQPMAAVQGAKSKEGTAAPQHMTTPHNKDPRDPNYCGDCPHPPQAPASWKPPTDQCCNTCGDAMHIYETLNLPAPPKSQVPQCIWEMSRDNPGCNLKGTFNVPKVKGNIHFAPGIGKRMPPNGFFGHVYSLNQLMKFNTSHTVNDFSIGDKAVARFSKRGVRSPLKGQTHSVSEPGTLGFIKYFVSIVPTNYRTGSKMDSLQQTIDAANSGEQTFIEHVSYEYAVTSHAMTFSQMASMFGMSMEPMVMFVFDFHPIQITNVFARPPFTRFLTKMCSIVGGVFVLLGFVDSVVSKHIKQ